MNPMTVHTNGADFSVFMGLAVGGVAYLIFGWSTVRRQTGLQDAILRAPTAGGGGRESARS